MPRRRTPEGSEDMSYLHDKIETNSALLVLLVILVVSVGGLVEIVPLYFQK